MSKGKFKLRTPADNQKTVQQIKFPEYEEGDTVVLFDGDILAFKVSSVCESKHIFTHKIHGEQYLAKSLKEFKSFLEDEVVKASNRIDEILMDEDVTEAAKKRRVSKLKKRIQSIGVYDDYERVDEQTPDPFSYCTKTLKDAHRRVLDYLGADHYEMYIGGDENFRLYLPLPEQYKLSVRKDAPRPIHLTASKEFLCNNLKGIRVKAIEADDVLQMRAYQLSQQGVRVIMYSNDKDRLQGWYGEYYNPDDPENILVLSDYLGYISDTKKGAGLKWLLYQVSQGDAIDGYSPKRWYSKKFYKRGYGQKGFYADFDLADTPKELLERFIEVHRDRLLIEEEYHWKSYDGKCVVSNWLGIIELMFSCAYMKLKVNDETTFSSICKDHGVDAGYLVFEVLTEEEYKDKFKDGGILFSGL